MKSATENEFGFCRDGKVFIKPYLNFPEREIGFVRESEEQSLQYFVDRFDLAKSKVTKLMQEVETTQNKGSYLTKAIQMKNYLVEFDGLGDFKPLLDEVERIEVYLTDLIKVNQEKNLEIKRALLQDIAMVVAKEDIIEENDNMKDLRMKWLKTGPVDKEFHEEIEGEFQRLMDDYFEKRKVAYEEKNRIIDEKLELLQNFVEKVNQYRKADNMEDYVEEVKEMQKTWKTINGIPPKKQAKLWKNFKKSTEMYFDKYNRLKGIDVKPRIDPRVQELIGMTGELEVKFRNQTQIIETSNLAKSYLVKWKDISANVRNLDRNLAERFRNICDKIFEMNYLLRVISYRHSNLDEKPRIEQLKIMINQMDYMTKKEKSELDLFIQDVTSDGTLEDRPVQSKINTQKRKIQIKEILLTGFKAELDSLI
jgi:hypothetical protein